MPYWKLTVAYIRLRRRHLSKHIRTEPYGVTPVSFKSPVLLLSFKTSLTWGVFPSNQRLIN